MPGYDHLVPPGQKDSVFHKMRPLKRVTAQSDQRSGFASMKAAISADAKAGFFA
jgi:hypothetical protein